MAFRDRSTSDQAVGVECTGTAREGRKAGEANTG